MDHDPDVTVDLQADPYGSNGLNGASAQEPGLDEDRLARLAMYAGIVMVGIGFLILYLGYNGAATNAVEVAQLPYVVSGGFGGVALIVLGAVMVMANALLKAQAMIRTELRATREALTELGETIAQGSRTAANGTNAPRGASNGHVVAMRGGSSFHSPGCRLVVNKAGLKELEPSAATAKGLMPCRVCKPAS